MANIHVSSLEKTHHSVAIATETPKEKSIFAQEESAEENIVSEEDSAKAQFFNDLTAQLKKLAKNLDEARLYRSTTYCNFCSLLKYIPRASLVRAPYG